MQCLCNVVRLLTFASCLAAHDTVTLQAKQFKLRTCSLFPLALSQMPDLVPPELRDPIPELAFVRPMATSARDALRRFSNHSHPSFTQSTRSLAYANTPAAPSVATSRVPSVRPSLALHTRNLDPADIETVMDIAVDTGIPIGYETNDVARVKRAKSKTFVGNLLRGFKKIPKALLPGGRPRKGTVSTDATHVTGNTLPVYMSTPSTPIAPTTGTAQYRQRGQSHLSEYDVPPSLQPADGHRSRNPSFHVYPPSVDADDVEQHEDNHSRIDPTVVSFPEPTLPDQTNYTADGTAYPIPSSPPASRSFVSDRLDTMTLHPPGPASTRPTSTRPSTRPTSTRPPSTQPDDGDDDPVSFQAHPLPSEDYRRMSKTYTGTKNSSTTMSTSEPSFDSERNGVINFFSTLRSMPWVASGRVTTDYRPGLSHGGWAWKRVSVYSSRSSSIFQSLAGKRPRRRSHGNKKRRFSFRPVQKSLASWYTDKTGKSAAGIREGGTLPSWVIPFGGNKEDVIDLLSSGYGSASGSGTRSSMVSGSERTGISSPPITPISPPSNYRRRSQREQPMHSTPHMRDRIRSLPRTESRRNERHSDRPSRRRPDRREREPRRHRRSPTMRPSTPYPTSYNYAPSAEQPPSPAMPVPVVVPQASMYFFQPPGVSTPADMGHSDGNTAPSPTHTIPQSTSLPLVYMPFFSSQMLQPGGQPGARLASVSEASEGTPPGFAGRGAFGSPTLSPPGGYS